MDSNCATVVIDEAYRWHHERRHGLSLWWAGHRAAAAAVLSTLVGRETPEAEELAESLRPQTGHFGLVVQAPEYVVAAVDVVRSYPLYYVDAASGCAVGNNAEWVLQRAGEAEPDDLSLLEAAMAGYVTGRYTLFRQLRQLRAGEVSLWRAGQRLDSARHYLHIPQALNRAPVASQCEMLGAAIDVAVNRLLDVAAGAPIWVPLSGGLDSRLVLGKLVERGYDNLQAFSYGTRGNSDARIARNVARELGVPWRFVATTRTEARRFYASEERRTYWRYADGHCGIPTAQDLLPILKLRDERALPHDTMVVNGQTGDFISGGHVPDSLMAGEPSNNTLIAAIVDKHYRLWRRLKTSENISRVEARIREVLDLAAGNSPLGCERAVALYQCWELEERQAKLVVNGQRTYDYVGLHWHLPLWDRGFVEFWRDIPPVALYRQALYQHYLQNWNFRGLFRDRARATWGWGPGTMAVILPLSWGARLLLGRRRRDWLFEYLKYFNRFGMHYACFRYRDFARHAHDLQQANSLYAQSWLEEQGLNWYLSRT